MAAARWDRTAWRMHVASLPNGALLLFLVACACAPPHEVDRDPPRVAGLSPGAPVTGLTPSFEIEFSETLSADTVDGDAGSDRVSIVLVPDDGETDALLADLVSAGHEANGLSRAHQDQAVPIEVVHEEATVRIRPRAPLLPQTRYLLVVASSVRDRAGNPLAGALLLSESFRFSFTTDQGLPVATLAMAAGALVSPDVRRLRVRFSQRVQGVGPESMRFEGGPASVESVLLDEGRAEADVLLRPLDDSQPCARLASSVEYQLALGEEIRTDSGVAVGPAVIPFTTSAGCDGLENAVLQPPSVMAGERHATIRFATAREGQGEVFFGILGAPLDCLGGPCPVRGVVVTEAAADTSPPRFVHRVEVLSLAPLLTYEFVVRAEDNSGGIALARGTFATAPLPRVALNEVMANPPQAAGAEPRGEYVELVNWGEEPLDLSGWSIAVDGGESEGGRSCALPSPLILQPGAYALIVGSDFDGSVYGIDVATVVARMSTTQLCGSLLNRRAQPLGLTESSGRVVSEVPSHADLVPSDDGRSVERVAPNAPDVSASFCFSRKDRGPSPGRANPVAALGCEPDEQAGADL